MTRQEHMASAKRRALEYLPANPQEAFTSLASDLGKHPETEGHPALQFALQLGMMLLIDGKLNPPGKMREFIEGFN